MATHLTAAAVGATILGVVFLTRVLVHVGRTPGGVDAWYFLAYANAVRHRPSLDVRLPQYLLQDERQSYPPLFPTLLALVPARWLDRWHWAVAPGLDCLHLGLLYVVTLRLTESVPVAAVAAALYGFTPHLISETRSLNPRPFGALLHTVGMLFLFKATFSGGWFWGAAVAAAALLFLSSAALAAAHGFVCAVFAVALADSRYLLVPASGFVLAFVLSGGHMARVVRNYVQAVAFWRRNHGRYGAHPLFDSPVYGGPRTRAARAGWAGFLGASTLQQLARLFGENPFVVVFLATEVGAAVWERRLYAWAGGLLALAVIATVLPPLRAFGPGRSYIKAAIFPSAYCVAYGIGNPAGLLRPYGLLALACLGASLFAIGFFYVHVRGKPTEQTAAVPPALAEAVGVLAGLPAGGVFVFPYMYADYVGYKSGHAVLWGGHSGDLRRLERLAPVITRPLPETFAEYGVRYLLLDTRYVAPEDLRLGTTMRERWRGGGFVLEEYAV